MSRVAYFLAILFLAFPVGVLRAEDNVLAVMICKDIKPGKSAEKLPEGVTPDSFKLSNIGFALTRPVAQGTKSGTTDVNMGVANFGEINLELNMAGAELEFFPLAAGGGATLEITFEIYQRSPDSTGKPGLVKTMSITLTRAYITKYEFAQGNGDPAHTQLSFGYGTIKLQRFGDTPKTTGWDIQTNRPIR